MTTQHIPSHLAAASVSAHIPFWRQIRWHLVLSYILLAIIPVFLIASFISSWHKSDLETYSLAQLASIAEVKRDQITSWLTDSSVAMQFLLSAPLHERMVAFSNQAAIDPVGQDEINAILARSIADQQASRPVFKSFFLYRPDGLVIAASELKLVDRLVSHQPYFEASLRDGYIQAPFYTPGSNELVMVITQRLLDDQGQLVAVMGGELDLAILHGIMLSQSGLGVTGETYLVSKDSRYLITPSRFSGYPMTQAYSSEGINQALEGRDGAGIYPNYRTDGAKVLGVYRWVPELQAGLLAEMGDKEALIGANNAKFFSGLLSFFFCIVALFLGLWVASRIASPIVELTRTAAAITQGDLHRRAHLKTSNELGELSTAFNIMTDRLQQNVVHLEERVRERTAALEEALGKRDETLRDLQEAFRTQAELQRTIRKLSSPVLPVLHGLVVMPLIGVIDSERAGLLVSELLGEIQKHHAKIVIIDVTGVPIIDTETARVLLSAASAARLLGTETLLVGIRPEIAQVIVSIGIDFSSLRTYIDLESGIAYALSRKDISA